MIRKRGCSEVELVEALFFFIWQRIFPANQQTNSICCRATAGWKSFRATKAKMESQIRFVKRKTKWAPSSWMKSAPNRPRG
jgi:hypothetical protein